ALAMWRATIKSLLAKKVRLGLTALAVVLGVGFMAGTYVLTDTMNKAFDELFAIGAESVDVVVRAEAAFLSTQSGGGGGGGTEDREPIPEQLLPTVAGVPGVKSATGDVAGYAQIVDPATGKAIGGVGPPTIGSSFDPSSTVITLREGRPPANSGEVAIDAFTAQAYDLGVGDRVQILFQGPAREFTITGTVGYGNADNLLGATAALFDVGTAQTVLQKPGVFDGISVVAEEGVSARALRDRIARVLPEGTEAVTGNAASQEAADALKEALGFFRTALLVFAFVALFVGAFIIFNTFSIIVAQRTRELALLRALGASRRQVLESVLVEAGVVGLFASAVGIGAGVLIALGLQAMLGAFGVDLPSTSTQLLPRTIVVSLAVGVVVTVVSSVFPARRAARVAPVEALRDAQRTAPSAGLRRRIVAGLVVTGSGGGSLLWGLFGGGSQAGVKVGLGAAVTFIGVAVLSPLVARPLARGIGAPLLRLGMSGKLGRENAMRNPRRTASTAAALMIGLGLVSFVAIFGASLRASASAVLDKTLKADFILSTGSFTPFSAEVAKEPSTRRELGAVSALRQGEARYGGESWFVAAVDPWTIGRLTTIDMVEGGLPGLAEGGLLVHTDVAEEHRWGVGDVVPVEFARTGVQRMELAGSYAEDDLLGDYLISLDTFGANFTEQLDSIVFAKAAGVPVGEARAAVRKVLADFPNVEVDDQAQFKEKQAGFIDQLLALVSALLGLAIVIALFGIVNTLGLSIFERTRELGLLRAVGMTRRQVRSMVRWESVIIAVLGAVLGAVIGVLFGWAMQRALVDQGVTELSIPAGQLGLYVALSALAGVLAAVLPARRAAGLNVLEAIAYE
ncbi:MAG: FtsX-like permease family protein, partial [Actinobacteria bacterium]|nr:FtsX-like permease family protein [Actinomycetota bacterium]